MRVVIEHVEAKYLEPGDLYSDRDHAYWRGMIDRKALAGVPLFLCLFKPTDDDTMVYRVLINPPVEKPKPPQQQFLPHIPPGGRPR